MGDLIIAFIFSELKKVSYFSILKYCRGTGYQIKLEIYNNGNMNLIKEHNSKVTLKRSLITFINYCIYVFKH